MKFTVSRDELAGALNMVSKAVSRRASLPILGGVNIRAEENAVVFEGTDLETAVRVHLAANVEEFGGTVAPCAMLASIVKNLDDAAVEVNATDDAMTVKSLSSEFTLQCFKTSDYPVFPSPVPDKSLDVDPSVFSEAISHSSLFAARDEGRPMLMGIKLDIAGGKIKATATDSYRLSIVELDDGHASDAEFSMVVPASSLADVAKMTSGYDSIRLGFAGNQAVIEAGGMTYITRVIEGKYPNCDQLLPKEHTTRVLADNKQLVAAIRRVGLVAARNNPVKFHFSLEENKAVVTCMSQDVGNAREYVDVQIEGEDADIAVNRAYLIDALSVLGDTVELELNGSLKPIVARTAGSDAQTCLVMPVRL